MRKPEDDFCSVPADCLRFRAQFTTFWLVGNKRMEKKMETTMMGYLGTTTRIHVLFLVAYRRPV